MLVLLVNRKYTMHIKFPMHAAMMGRGRPPWGAPAASSHSQLQGVQAPLSINLPNARKSWCELGRKGAEQ